MASLLDLDSVPNAPGTRLLDRQALDRLSQMLGAEEFQAMLRTGMDDYRGYCDAMRNASNGPAAIAAEAHKLRGSAACLGLSAIGDDAARIESAVEGGQSTDPLVHELEATIDATRRELAALGMLVESAK